MCFPFSQFCPPTKAQDRASQRQLETSHRTCWFVWRLRTHRLTPKKEQRAPWFCATMQLCLVLKLSLVNGNSNKERKIYCLGNLYCLFCFTELEAFKYLCIVLLLSWGGAKIWSCFLATCAVPVTYKRQKSPQEKALIEHTRLACALLAPFQVSTRCSARLCPSFDKFAARDILLGQGTSLCHLFSKGTRLTEKREQRKAKVQKQAPSSTQDLQNLRIWAWTKKSKLVADYNYLPESRHTECLGSEHFSNMERTWSLASPELHAAWAHNFWVRGARTFAQEPWGVGQKVAAFSEATLTTGMKGKLEFHFVLHQMTLWIHIGNYEAGKKPRERKVRLNFSENQTLLFRNIQLSLAA